MKLPTARQMRALDRCAIEDFGIPGVVLMENAGAGTVRMMLQHLGPCSQTFACILVGPGNNGGDGLVIGRHLHQLGCRPIFFLLVHPDSLTGDAAVNMKIISSLRLPYHIIDSTARVSTMPVLYHQAESHGLPCYAIVDAVFGTGLTREVEGHYAEVISLVNQRNFARKVPVVAVDCPSGMNADTGRIMGGCMQATFTATYGCAKPGHYLHDSKEVVGTLEIVDIGIPPEALEKIEIDTELLDLGFLQQISPGLQRKSSTHKGEQGHLLIAAGAVGKTGAAILSGRGALRSGCGMVSLCVPHALNAIMETTLIEAMTIPMPNSPYSFSGLDAEQVLHLARDKKAAVIGPGLGTDHATAEFVCTIYRELPVPLVVDADALNILGAFPEVLRQAGGVRLFTPHPGELSRLLGTSTGAIQGNRIEAARKACAMVNTETSEHIVVLKGAGTIICQPRRPVLINTSGNPGMATGGMGDVLSGVIGSLLCQGLEPFAAAAAGVYLHGAAADTLYRQMGHGYTASEVADRLPTVIHALTARRSR